MTIVQVIDRSPSVDKSGMTLSTSRGLVKQPDNSHRLSYSLKEPEEPTQTKTTLTFNSIFPDV